jgi:hypothetical protein
MNFKDLVIDAGGGKGAGFIFCRYLFLFGENKPGTFSPHSWWPSQNGQKQPIGYRELSIGNKSKTKFKAAMKTCCNKPITKIRIYQGGTPAQARKQRCRQRCRCRIYLIEIDQFI